jgi:hypothetical protein
MATVRIDSPSHDPLGRHCRRGEQFLNHDGIAVLRREKECVTPSRFSAFVSALDRISRLTIFSSSALHAMQRGRRPSP